MRAAFRIAAALAATLFIAPAFAQVATGGIHSSGNPQKDSVAIFANPAVVTGVPSSGTAGEPLIDGGTGTAPAFGTLNLSFTTGTLGCAELPALTGDVVNTNCGVTVSKVNGASLPASAGLLGTNASSQIIAAPASGVTAGSYTAANITVNAQGQVTAASNGTAGGGTVTTTGTPASGNIAAFSGATSITPATASQVLSLVNSQTCNAQTGTTYTFVIGDANNCVTMANAAANTVTVPPNSSVAFPVGTTITVVQNGAGATTLGPGTGVTLQSAKYGSSTSQTYAFAAEYSCVSIQKTATDTWFVSSCDYNPGGGSGTVTSVAMTVPTWLSVTGSPITTSGTLAVSATTGQTANEVLASPNGTTGAVGLRALVGADLPPINLASTANGGVAGTLGVANGGTGATSSVTYLIDTGTAFTLGTGTGACATDSVVAAGAANGEVTCTGTTGASTLVVNLPTATHGWACSASDITQGTALPESAFTTTSATVKGSVTASDDIVIGCTGF